MTRLTMPRIAARGASSRMKAVTVQQANSPSTILDLELNLIHGVVGTSEGRERIARRSGTSTPTKAASSPPQVASATLCHVTMRCAAIGKAKER